MSTIIEKEFKLKKPFFKCSHPRGAPASGRLWLPTAFNVVPYHHHSEDPQGPSKERTLTLNAQESGALARSKHWWGAPSREGFYKALWPLLWPQVRKLLWFISLEAIAGTHSVAQYKVQTCDFDRNRRSSGCTHHTPCSAWSRTSNPTLYTHTGASHISQL